MIRQGLGKSLLYTPYAVQQMPCPREACDPFEAWQTYEAWKHNTLSLTNKPLPASVQEYMYV